MNTKIETRCLQDFIKKSSDTNDVPFDVSETKNNYSEEATVNTLNGLIQVGMIFQASEMAQRIIDNGLPFQERKSLYIYNNLEGVI